MRAPLPCRSEWKSSLAGNSLRPGSCQIAEAVRRGTCRVFSRAVCLSEPMRALNTGSFTTAAETLT
eukprot:15452398-Alexandrium_andersonii.AAC.1